MNGLLALQLALSLEPLWQPLHSPGTHYAASFTVLSQVKT